MQGYIKLSRSIQEHWIWKKYPFSEGQAWIDLILLANHEDVKMPYKNEFIICERGTVNRSILSLAERWKWSRKKTQDFLKLLEKDNMVLINATTHRTTITLVNYDNFQLQGTTKDTTKDTTKEQQGIQQGSTNKNDKNDNNKEILPKGNIKKSDTDEIQKERNDYQGIINKWNEICVSYPKVTSLSEARKKAINARLKTYTVDDLIKAFNLAEESDFLKGKNDRNWSANFDWIIKDTNLAKVLDGNYKNKNKGETTNENATSYKGFDFSKFE